MSDDKTKLVDEKSDAPSFGSIHEKPKDADAKSETSSIGSETDKTAVRWYVLTLFCLWALTNLAFWNTWGPIAQSSMLVFGWTQLDVVMPVIVGTLASVVTQIFYSWLIEVIGVRLVSLMSAGLMLIGAGVRCITPYTPAATWLINFAAIMNGLGAPIFIGGGPLISSVWFPSSERITATSSAIAFAYGGIAFAFLLGPFVVNYNPETFPGAILSEKNSTHTQVTTEPSRVSANFSQEFIDSQRQNIMHLMYIEFGWICFLFIVTVAYFPEKPPKPPSLSATQLRTKCAEGLKILFSDAHFWMVLVPFALTQGFFFGWGSALELNLHPIGVTQYEAGWVGFAASLAGIAGTLTVGRIADSFSRYLKVIVIIFLTVAVIFCAWMTAIIDGLLSMNLASLIISTVVAGTATQATCPLFFEMACESSYPVSESVIGGVLTMAGNVLNVIFLLVFLIPNVGTKWLNYALIGALIGSVIFISFYKQTFRRLAIDNEEVEGYQNLDGEKTDAEKEAETQEGTETEKPNS